MSNVFTYVKDLVEYWPEFNLIPYDFPSLLSSYFDYIGVIN